MRPRSLHFCPFSESHAKERLSWRYPPPYELYNPPEPESQQAIRDLLRDEMLYFAVLNEQGEMIAFRCFGRDAQVPGGDYAEPALDMGGGLRPDLTGMGLGRHIIAAAMKNKSWELSRRAIRMGR